MFSGNADSFATRVAQLEGGLAVRIVSVPEFSKSGVAVLVDLASLECTPLHVGVDSSLCAEDAPAEPMDAADELAEP